MLKTKFIIISLVISVIVAEALNIFLSNSLAGSSMEVSSLKEQIAKIDEKNTSLKTELLSYSSFENISSRAAQLGFTENKETAIMINAPLKVALR